MPKIKTTLNSNVAFEAAEQKWLSKHLSYFKRNGGISEVVGTVLKPIKVGERLMLFKKGKPVYFEIAGIKFRQHDTDKADPSMRGCLLYLKGEDIEIMERDRFIKDGEYHETDIYKDIVKKCCSCSKRVSDEYISDDVYAEIPYAFMETVVSNVIIETSDMNERRQLLDIVDAMLDDEMDYETQTLAGVAVIEAIYFVCGYDFFIDNADISGDNVLREAKILKDYYERNEKCSVTGKNRHDN